MNRFTGTILCFSWYTYWPEDSRCGRIRSSKTGIRLFPEQDTYFNRLQTAGL